jgi:4-amino-4-deoxy-L-arabinose transferase-like glycosyltransferase
LWNPSEDENERMRIIRQMAGAIFLVAAGIALFDFELLGRLFLFLSQDGSIVPLSMLQLRLCLLAGGVVGVYLIFAEYFTGWLASVNGFLMNIGRPRFLVISLSVALALRVAMVLFFPFRLWIDHLVYDELSWHWAKVGGYYVGDFPTAYRPPGYPFFLSRLYVLFGHHPQLAAVANIVFSLAIVYISYLIVRKIWSENVARWTMIILIFFPSQLLFVNLPASEPMFTMLFLMSILAFMTVERPLKRKRLFAFLGGVLLGLATLTRALTIIYLIIPTVFWFLQTKSIRRTAINTLIAAIGLALVVTPWMLRNYRQKGKFTITTNAGINLLIGNQPGSGMGWNQPVTEQFAIDDPRRETYVDSAARHQAWQYIKNDPAAFFKRGVLKVMYFYAVDMEGLGYELGQLAAENRSDRYIYCAFITEAFYLMVLLFGFFGIFSIYIANADVRRPEGFILWATILMWTAVHFVFFGDGRFHFPIIPMISAFAGLYIKYRVDQQLSKGCKI